MGLVDLPGVAVQYQQEWVRALNANDTLILADCRLICKQIWQKVIVSLCKRTTPTEVVKTHGYENLNEEKLLAMEEFASSKDIFVSPAVYNHARGHTMPTSLVLRM